MSELIHLWDGRMAKYERWTKCGLVQNKRMNVLWASTANALQINPSWVCKTCYRLGPPWLAAVK